MSQPVDQPDFDLGGEPACLAPLVCPVCGKVNGGPPPLSCPDHPLDEPRE